MSKIPSYIVVAERNVTEEKKIPTALEAVVKKFGKGAYIYLPKEWQGKKVKLVLVE